MGSDEVVILPNNKNIRPVAEQVDALSDKTVRVVATGSILEGFAALLAYDPAAGAAVNAASMGESAARVVPGRGHPGRARRRDRRRRGARGRLDRPVARRRGLHRRLGGDGHAPAPRPPARATSTSWSRSSRARGPRRPTPAGSASGCSEEYPDVALEVHHGGQPLYPYLLGIE